MIRFIVRVLGFLCLAAGFVGLVIDGTRSIANGTLVFTRLGAVANLSPSLEASARQVHPFLWDPILLNVFLLPASLVGCLLGILLLWLGRRPREPIGHLAGP